MARYASLAVLALSAVIRADTLVMKSGEKYQLKVPATHKNGRVTFTTTANRFLSVSESEVAQEIAGPPPPPPKQINRTDSRQLGAIAREQREEQGKSAPVAGKSADKKTLRRGLRGNPQPDRVEKKEKGVPRLPASAPGRQGPVASTSS